MLRFVSPVHFLLVFVPVTLVLAWQHAAPAWIFIAACLAIVPLAGVLGTATEQLTLHGGPMLGGLLNASFGNAAELIIGVFALRAGELDVVKASITGSILGNLLAVLGVAMIAGGWRAKEVRFNKLAAESGIGTMTLAVVALVIPAIVDFVTRQRFPGRIESMSVAISVILLAAYVAGLVFNLKTHRVLFTSAAEEAPTSGEKPWRVATTLGVLAAAAVGIAIVSELLVGSLDEAGTALGFSKVFMGVIVVALVGNAAEHATAVQAAGKGQMNLAVAIAMGSSTQIALFVAPVLVLIGHVTGRRLGLEFSMLEVVAVVLSSKAVGLLIVDGKTNWFEGVLLLAVYAILAVAFYYV